VCVCVYVFVLDFMFAMYLRVCVNVSMRVNV
jgi:hypothetical protein